MHEPEDTFLAQARGTAVFPGPAGYTSTHHVKGQWIRSLRWLYIYLPFQRSTYAKAKAVIVGSSYNYLTLGRRIECNRLFLVQENGIPEKDVVAARRYDDMPPLKVIFLGQPRPFQELGCWA